jgi:hypothetical protein
MRAVFVPVIFVSVLFAGAITPRPASAAWPQFGRAIDSAFGDQLAPRIATDGANGAIITWLDRRSFPFNIDAQHVLATGDVDPAWPANGRALLTDALTATIVPQGQEFPDIVSDGAGGAIITWPDARDNTLGLDIYVQHILASGVVDSNWPVNGATLTVARGQQTHPFIVSDGDGGAIITWVDGRAGATVNDLDIYAAHVSRKGLVDGSWPDNGTPLSTAPGAQFSPAILADGAGGAMVTWADARGGNGMDIYAQHVLATGVVDPAWPINGRALSVATGTQITPRIISDGATGAIVAWTDTRDGTNEIFAQRVLISGVIASGWPINGRFVSIGGIDEVVPTLAPDGANGAIVAWGGGRSGHHNMRAHHLLGSGVLDAAWPVGGTSLSFASSEETDQVMVSDGAGGAIVAWQQGAFDIFAQHVLAAGTLDPAYPINGRPLVNLPDQQQSPAIVAAGAGGAIVTWRDQRSGRDFDIFAMQVLEALPTGVHDTTPSFTFASPNPNPANAMATLRFGLPRETSVRLNIYDVAGRRVRELDSGVRTAGEHAITWDLRDGDGHAVASGLYFARLEVEGRAVTRKIMAVK